MRTWNDSKKNQHLLLNRHVVTDSAPFTLESDARGVIRSGGRRVEGRAALRIGVVVVVLHHNISDYSTTLSVVGNKRIDTLAIKLTYRVVASPMIIPPCRGVNYSCWVDTAHYIYKGQLRIWRTRELSPSFVVDDLHIFTSAYIKKLMAADSSTQRENEPKSQLMDSSYARE